MTRYFLFLLLLLMPTFGDESRFTPSDVYTELKKIDLEIELLKKHFKIKKDINKERKEDRIDINILPKHNYQLTYIVLVKINNLRKKYKLSRVEEPVIEPSLHLNPDIVYGQTQRILSEIRIFKKLLGIDKNIKAIKEYSLKRAKLNNFSAMNQALLNNGLVIGIKKKKK